MRPWSETVKSGTFVSWTSGIRTRELQSSDFLCYFSDFHFRPEGRGSIKENNFVFFWAFILLECWEIKSDSRISSLFPEVLTFCGVTGMIGGGSEKLSVFPSLCNVRDANDCTDSLLHVWAARIPVSIETVSLPLQTPDGNFIRDFSEAELRLQMIWDQLQRHCHSQRRKAGKLNDCWVILTCFDEECIRNNRKMTYMELKSSSLEQKELTGRRWTGLLSD